MVSSTYRILFRLFQHEAVEVRCELRVAVERQHLRDVLIRSHDDDASLLAVYASYVEYIVAAFYVGAIDFFVVLQAKLSGISMSGMASMSSSLCAC